MKTGIPQQPKGALLVAEGIPFAAVPLAVADQLPTRMRVLRWGENPNARKKRVHVGRVLQASMQRGSYPFHTIPLDFEHNTLPGTPAYHESREPRLVAAHCRVELVEGDGVYVVPIRWTAEGKQRLPHYCDLSASPVVREDGEVVAVVSAALCRVGAVPEMELPLPLSAVALLTNTEGNEGMDWKELICKALGLDPTTATDDEIVAKLAAALKAEPDSVALNAAVEAVIAPLKATIEGLQAPATTPTANEGLQAQVVALSASVARFEAELIKRDKQALLETARQEGKVVALNASAVESMSLADLQDHVDKLPATVPLSAVTPTGLKQHQVGTGITDEQRTIALNCGMDPEKIFGDKK